MKCPFCNDVESKVLDSRPTDECERIRRRRECNACGRRFTTYEEIETLPIMVIKKDGSIEVFDKSKIEQGILKACEKRPITLDQIEKISNKIKNDLLNKLVREISSIDIGNIVMESLHDLDKVAYVRFASVYRQFNDPESFMKEIEKIIKKS